MAKKAIAETDDEDLVHYAIILSKDPLGEDLVVTAKKLRTKYRSVDGDNRSADNRIASDLRDFLRIKRNNERINEQMRRDNEHFYNEELPKMTPEERRTYWEFHPSDD